MSSIAETTELAPLRAKSGWIVALGVVYVIAGLIALGSVVFATVVTVFIVGVMMLIAGVAEVINAFKSKLGANFYFASYSAPSTSSPALSHSKTPFLQQQCSLCCSGSHSLPRV